MSSLVFLLVLCLLSVSVSFSSISPLPRISHHHSKRSSISLGTRDPVIDPVYQYRQFFYVQRRDHFNFQNSNLTFHQQVLINDSYWRRPQSDGSGAGPIFFYAGNEGKIGVFANNSGFMWDLAPKYGALLVFPEHRYYGLSMPINDDPVQSMSTPEGLQYLTAEQAMADYAEFAIWLRANLSTTDAPIILFGGSYGGMLASWMRIKYPAIFAGAIASSAPIWQFDGMYDPTGFNGVLKRDAAAANPLCPNAFNASWGIMQAKAQTQKGRDEIQQIFNVCDRITSPSAVTSALYGYITEAVGDLAMVDYPYQSTFLGDIPANPINVMCSYFTQDALANPNLLLSQLHSAIGVYYNYTGGLACYDLNSAAGIATLGDYAGWNFQSCTEMIMPIGQYGLPTDMFFPAPWNLTADVLACQKSYPGVIPRPNWAELNLAGKDLSAASNIVFTNGNLDPWGPGGVWKNFSATVVAYEVIAGAHHLDLRHETPYDPPGVLWVRAAMTKHIENWINGVSPSDANNCSSDDTFPNRGQSAAIGAVVAVIAVILIWRGYLWYKATDPARGQIERDTADRPVQPAPASNATATEPLAAAAPLGGAAVVTQRQGNSVNGGGYVQLRG